MRLSSFDALQRGLLNLRANLALIGLQIVQSVVLTAVTLAGLVPLVLAFGVGTLRAIWSGSSAAWQETPNAAFGEIADRILQRWPEQWPLLVAAMLATGAVWTVAFLVYCWFQAGILGQLAAGERRAATAAAPAWPDFRVFRWSDFVSLANRRTWGFFWLINLYLLLGLVLVFLVVVLLALVALAAGSEPGIGLLFVFSCLSMLGLFCGWLVLWAASEVGKAEMVVGETGTWEAFRRSFATLGRRLGAVALLVVLFLVCSVAIGLVFMPFSLGLDLAMGDSFARQIAADVLLMLIQSVVSAAIVLGLSSSLVSLVGGER